MGGGTAELVWLLRARWAGGPGEPAVGRLSLRPACLGSPDRTGLPPGHWKGTATLQALSLGHGAKQMVLKGQLA